MTGYSFDHLLYRMQASLYDEFDKLLVSKFMKIEDVIRPGETLTFYSYLVDIGEKCGGHEPESTSNFQGIDKKVTVKLEKLDSHEPKKNTKSLGICFCAGLKLLSL